MDLPSFAIGLAAGLGLAAFFVWTRRERSGGLDRVPVVRAPLPPALDRAIDDLLSRGRKIEAIKLLRDATRCGLKEAKDRIEALEQERR
jgi:hypothetical protein